MPTGCSIRHKKSSNLAPMEGKKWGLTVLKSQERTGTILKNYCVENLKMLLL
jgi:hypothetical protein